MTVHWGIDLGTSNTTVCEDRSGSPHIVNLPELVKIEPLTQTPVIMSCVCVLDRDARNVLIGQKAIDYNWDGQSPGYASGFKRWLGRESQRTVARVDGRTFTAADAARLYLRELIAALEARFGDTVEDVTIATPCGAFETYRAELRDIVRSLDRRPLLARIWSRITGRTGGIRFRTVDEPVAAALGYGVDVGRAATTLVAFDFGAGSIEAAAVRMPGGAAAATGRSEVLAKQGLRLGGDDVDRWILDRMVPRALHDWPEWEVALRWEAERTKLLASAGREATFTFQNESYGTLDHPGLARILADNGLYDDVRGVLERLLEELAHRHGLGPDDISDVLLEGGSTLLPGVRDLVGDVFSRDRVREWLPFESVARGCCIFAAGGRVEDFIYHDYALRVRRDDGDVEYELLIPSGTRFPTAEDHVVRYYASGFDGQDAINLFVCEVGRVAGRPVEWEERSSGNAYFVPGIGEPAFTPCLNEADPALQLRPAGRGSAPRLRVSYMVDGDRWLCATVHDLERKTDLMVRKPVVKLR